MNDKIKENIKKIIGKHSNHKLAIDLFLQDIKKKNEVMVTVDQLKYLKYEEKIEVVRTGTHIGQRKLFLNEVQFLTMAPACKYCIYAGSAPGNKTHFLSLLFPDIKFILIDPNRFDMMLPDKHSHRIIKHKDIVHICSLYKYAGNSYLNKQLRDMTNTEKKSVITFIKKSKHNIYVFEDYMDNEYSEFFKILKDIIFISDVRTNSSEIDNLPHDIDICWNNVMMYNWITILNPLYSMLKIRPLYGSKTLEMKDICKKDFDYAKKNGIDFYDNCKKNKLILSKGILYIQPWTGCSSAELRLCIKRKDISNLIDYNNDEVEGRMNYYNLLNRTWLLHKNNNASKKINFCYCNDCSLENLIWEQYTNKYKNVANSLNLKSIHQCVELLNKMTNRPLSQVHTPIWQSMANVEVFNKAIQKGVEIKSIRDKKVSNKKFNKQLGNKGAI